MFLRKYKYRYDNLTTQYRSSGNFSQIYKTFCIKNALRTFKLSVWLMMIYSFVRLQFRPSFAKFFLYLCVLKEKSCKFVIN